MPPELGSVSDGDNLAVSLVSYPLIDGGSAITSSLNYTVQSTRNGAAMSHVIVASDGKAAYAMHDGAASYSNGQEVLPDLNLSAPYRAALVRIDLAPIQDAVQGKTPQQSHSGTTDSTHDGKGTDSYSVKTPVQQQSSANMIIMALGVGVVVVAVSALAYWFMRQRRRSIRGGHTKGGKHLQA